MTVSDSIVVAADPLDIYDVVSDPRRMGEWSPENCGADVATPDQPAYVGMRFSGHNRRGPLHWETRCTVTAADPGERFAFEVHRLRLRIPVVPAAAATWEYTFTPVESGTRVTGTWTDRRSHWPDFLIAQFDRFATGGRQFADFQRESIAHTLESLKDTLEAPLTR